MSDEEVRRRRAQGAVNRIAPSTSRPFGDILRGNVLTLFNAILAAAVVLLLAVGQQRDAFLTGSLIVFSVAASTAQEIRAKLRLEKIALLARARVRVLRDGTERSIDQTDIVLGDFLVLSRGEPAVVDGTVVLADQLEVDESLLTGESEPVVKTVGDRVLSASFCVAGSGVYVAEGIGEASYAQRLASAARTYRTERTPTQKLLDRVLRALLVIVITFSALQAVGFLVQGVSVVDAVRATAVMTTLVPQGLLLMSTAAYSVAALRLAQSRVLVQRLSAVESLSHADTLCLDKTGTLTRNQLRLRDVIPLEGGEQRVERLVGSFAASFPEPNTTLLALASSLPSEPCPVTKVVPFSSERRWSALTFAAPCPTFTYVLGSPEVLLKHSEGANEAARTSTELAAAGQRVLLFARARRQPPHIDGAPRLPEHLQPLALVALEEEVRGDAAETLEALVDQGVSVKLLSGDNPETVLGIARRAGLPSSAQTISESELTGLSPEEKAEVLDRTTVFGRTSPQGKQEIIQSLQANGHHVAMVGDGVNDVLALKQANVGIAMRGGSPAARGVADVVLLNDSFAVLPKAVSEGRRVINSMVLLVKLFLVRDAATLEVILASSFVGAPFPLLPPHAALIALLTVGIPALFIVAWASPAMPRRESLGAMAVTVLQIGTTSALAIMTVYGLALIGFDADVAQARTAVVVAALASGLLALIFLWYPLDAPPSLLLSDRRIVVLAAVIFVVFLVGLYWPAWQRYFELTPLSPFNWMANLSIVLAWFGALRLVVRYRLVERLFS